MYTVVNLFTALTRNIGQNIKAWENTEYPDYPAMLRIGPLYHSTRKIVANEILR